MKEGKVWLIIAILALVTAICIVVPKMCPNTMNNLFPEVETPVVETLRFQRVETFLFEKKYSRSIAAVIYEDTETGVKYLYIWQGANHGGPCITRLWEE